MSRMLSCPSTLESSAANGRPIVQWLDISKNRRLARTDHHQPALRIEVKDADFALAPVTQNDDRTPDRVMQASNKADDSPGQCD